jgi:hypothetical protein
MYVYLNARQPPDLPYAKYIQYANVDAYDNIQV